jgi:hypothetical protein
MPGFGDAFSGAVSGAITGAPTANPVVITVTTIIGFLGGLFGGGTSGNIKQAFEGIRAAIREGLAAVLHFAALVARALNPIFGMLKRLWFNVLKPLLGWLQHIADRIRSIYDKILKPYLDTINKIRKMILDVYEKYIRPVIVIIDRVRRVLAVLRLAHIKIADDLDRLLLKLENKLTQPIFIALQKINELGGWFNVLLRVDMILQETIFSRSLWQWKKDVGAYGLRALLPETGAYVPLQPHTTADTIEDTRAYLLNGSGRFVQFEDTARRAAESVMG